MAHDWRENILAWKQPEKDGDMPTPIYWFPKCLHCSAQVCLIGKKLYYRATANHEWSQEEPSCHE